MMFTEGLDESAISWIKQVLPHSHIYQIHPFSSKFCYIATLFSPFIFSILALNFGTLLYLLLQGSDVKKSQSRSPLTDKLGEKYAIPRSPLAYSNSSSHVLPPLKFHSGLLGAHNTVALSTDSNEDEYEDEDDCDGDDNDSESVASAPDELHLHYSDEEIFNLKSKMNSNPGLGLRPTLIRGLSKENLRIEVPGNTKRFIDGDSMFLGSATSLASGSLSNCQLRGKVQPHSAYVRNNLHTLPFSQINSNVVSKYINFYEYILILNSIL